MERREYAAKLSFECSPLAVAQLDALVVEYGYRSRGELLRVWMENALHKQRINPNVEAEIERHHDLLGMIRPRSRPSPRYMRAMRPMIAAADVVPSSSPEEEKNAQDCSGTPISPEDGPQVG